MKIDFLLDEIGEIPDVTVCSDSDLRDTLRHSVTSQSRQLDKPILG